MKTPIPTAIPALNDGGMALMISSRTLKKERMRNSTAEWKMMPSATSQGTPIATITTNEKKKFSPMAGASAMG